MACSVFAQGGSCWSVSASFVFEPLVLTFSRFFPFKSKHDLECLSGKRLSLAVLHQPSPVPNGMALVNQRSLEDNDLLRDMCLSGCTHHTPTYIAKSGPLSNPDRSKARSNICIANNQPQLLLDPILFSASWCVWK
ncbi:hypothetical protein BaRGS_00002259, partial [Batillaria attramentaria]